MQALNIGDIECISTYSLEYEMFTLHDHILNLLSMQMATTHGLSDSISIFISSTVSEPPLSAQGFMPDHKRDILEDWLIMK